ncbi:hypothetical protein SAMN05892877_1074 [Rhizobium subbaraonis]|uniref:Transglycosylase SLT domain-containing protein n=1 Tax=Rhizobium subbaraonis TaxID=908946 RepID=A0A285UE50_9HYPH|nr:hypothetical protein [Rhizobium subbaraonis]SOC40102.1 hypothetical protein SAMN05892877_1074 [Rhizobium subbaraonis]
MNTIEEYIRAAARQRGIDPDIAVRVAKSEGGLSDPVRQSDARKNGIREPSYGPFQLLVGGEGTGFPAGLGNDFIRQTGLDPRKPENAFKGIDYALDTAARDGWGRWYGAKAIGLDNRAGIGGAPATSAVPDGPKGQESYKPIFGGVPTMTAQPSVSPTPANIPAAVQQAAAPKTKRETANDIFGMLAMAQDQGPQFSPVQIVGPSGDQASGLSQLVQALRIRVI